MGRRGVGVVGIVGMVAVVDVVTIVAACGNRTSLETETLRVVPEYVAEMTSAVCDALRDCCAAAHYAYDESSCVAQMQAQYESQYDGLKRGTIAFDAAAANKCREAVRARE